MRKVYMVYRRAEEVPVFYGWTYFKSVLKVFYKQRSKEKYMHLVKPYEDVNLDGDSMIDWIELPSRTLGAKLKLFMTANEACNSEKLLLRYFRDKAHLVRDKFDVVSVFLELKDIYRDALDTIGFRPPEIECVFDSVEPNEMDERIDDAYAVAEYPSKMGLDGDLPGRDALNEYCYKVLYSLEGFLLVMGVDM